MLAYDAFIDGKPPGAIAVSGGAGEKCVGLIRVHDIVRSGYNDFIRRPGKILKDCMSDLSGWHCLYADGSMAMIAYAMMRMTNDIDIVMEVSPADGDKIIEEFGLIIMFRTQSARRDCAEIYVNLLTRKSGQS